MTDPNPFELRHLEVAIHAELRRVSVDRRTLPTRYRLGTVTLYGEDQFDWRLRVADALVEIANEFRAQKLGDADGDTSTDDVVMADERRKRDAARMRQHRSSGDDRTR